MFKQIDEMNCIAFEKTKINIIPIQFNVIFYLFDFVILILILICISKIIFKTKINNRYLQFKYNNAKQELKFQAMNISSIQDYIQTD